MDNLVQMNQQLQQKIEVLEQQTLPWVLTDDQRKKLAESLANVPPGETYELSIEALSNCNGCVVYTQDLVSTWESLPHWKVETAINFGLNPRLTGVFFGVDPSVCPSGEIQLITKALNTAGINHELRSVNAKGADGKIVSFPCRIVVGNKP
jgi:hypothetical protein